MTAIKPLRAVLALRISDLKDESTSIPRQRERCTAHVTQRGMVVVGEACDEDVSASTVSPADRPKLGAWMRRPDEFDAFVFWRQDRAVRSMTDMADLCRWARDHGKRLLFTEGGIPEVDLTSPTSEFMVMAFAFAAQMEAQAIKDRVNSWYGYARSTDRWTGGPAPFGYRTAPHPDGGKLLEVDPETAQLVREAADRVLKGDSLNEIVQDWNTRGIPTNTARARLARGKVPRETFWSGFTLGRILRSEGLLGRRQETIRDQDGKKIGMKSILIKGSYVQIAEPVIPLEVWHRVSKVLDQRATTRERSLETSALLGVVFCGACGRPLYQNRSKAKRPDGTAGKEYRYYRCIGGNGAKGCPRVRFRGDDSNGLEALVEMLFLNKVGPVEVYRRRHVEGEDHSAELDSVNRRIRRLRDDRESGLYDGADDEAEYSETMRWLMSERKRLEALPTREATVVSEPTGETYAEVWSRLDTEGRRRFLIDTGVRCEIGSVEGARRQPLITDAGAAEETANRPLLNLMLPEDLEQRVQDWMDGNTLPEVTTRTSVLLDPEVLSRFTDIKA
ncbi:recombinase family protein [Catenulispora pinistramenti]|uniref:recombinase family protein n=1 Tax=Catenulispora pinistramenti TaxID=2705254 RepID=UPI001E4CEA98|nr:recombinase family protein [Catenulispora pinistramenti]